MEKTLKDLENKKVANIKINLDYEITRAGLIRPKNAKLVYDETVIEKITPKPTESKKEDEKSDAKKAQQKDEKKEEKQTEEKVYQRSKNLTLKKLSESIKCLSDFPDLFKESEELLKLADSLDLEKFQKSENKNKLESLIYKFNNAVTEPETNIFLDKDNLEHFAARAEEIDKYIYSPEISTATLKEI